MCLSQCSPGKRREVLAVLGNLLLLSSLLLFLVSFIKLIRSPQEECAFLYSSEPSRNLLHVQISGPSSYLLTQKLGAGDRSLCSTFSQVLQVILVLTGSGTSHLIQKCSVESKEGALVAHSVLCGTVGRSDGRRLMFHEERSSREEECFSSTPEEKRHL